MFKQIIDAFMNPSQGFKITLIIIVFAFFCAVSTMTRAETNVTVTPYFSLGAWHRDCSLTDEMICNNDAFGSDTPGTIDLGLRFEPDRPSLVFLYADEVDVGWHHQSYVDRGWLIPGVLDFGGKESQIDMYGVRFTWKIDFLKFKFSY